MKSIQRHLSIGLLVGFALLLGSGGTAIYLATRSALYHQFDSGLKSQALILSGFVKIERLKLELEFPQALVGPETSLSAARFYELFKTNGAGIARSPALGGTELPFRFGPPDKPAIWNLALPGGGAGRALGVRFVPKFEVPRRAGGERRAEAHMNDDEGEEEESDKPEPGTGAAALQAAQLPGELVLVIAGDRAHLEETLNRVGAIVLLTGGLTLLATATLVPLTLGLGLAPLRRLARNAQGIDATSLKSRFPSADLPRELSPIAHCLNELLGRLEGSFERERRFSADLAHELRTPVAGLRATAEVALKYGETSDRESFQTVLEIAQEMELIVDRLLMLARSEQRALPLQPRAVKLQPLIEALWNPLAARATARQISVSFQLAPGDELQTDPALLRAILGNLLANAADYTSADGRIAVCYQQRDGHFELSVSNTANQLGPGDIPRLFERFWRKDQARSGSNHTGLGLALAKSLAEMLGFGLSASLNGQSILRMCLNGKIASYEPPPVTQHATRPEPQ